MMGCRVKEEGEGGGDGEEEAIIEPTTTRGRGRRGERSCCASPRQPVASGAGTMLHVVSMVLFILALVSIDVAVHYQRGAQIQIMEEKISLINQELRSMKLINFEGTHLVVRTQNVMYRHCARLIEKGNNMPSIPKIIIIVVFCLGDCSFFPLSSSSVGRNVKLRLLTIWLRMGRPSWVTATMGTRP